MRQWQAEQRETAIGFDLQNALDQRAGGGRIQLLRSDLHDALTALRRAISDVIAHAEDNGHAKAADLADFGAASRDVYAKQGQE